MDDVRVDDTWISDMRLVAEIHNIELSDEQLAAFNVPQSSDALYYYAYLARYIEKGCKDCIGCTGVRSSYI